MEARNNVINVAITDDHPLMRAGIKDLISSFDHYQVTIEASEGAELIEKIGKTPNHLPDICILEVSTRGMSGYETLKQLKRRWPGIKVLIFSFFHDNYIILEMIRYGANGYLGKDCTSTQFAQALTSIYYSNFYYSDPLAKKIFEMQLHQSPLLPHITDREMEFLRHCCSELHYNEIAEIMSVSKRTVESFRDALFSKFTIKTRTGLAMFALQNGLVSLSNIKFNS